MAPGSRSEFGANPMFAPEFFRKQMCCIEERTCDVTLLGLFGAPAVIQCPRSDSAPGELCTPRYAPVWLSRV